MAKHKSRATRCGETAGSINAAAAELSGCVDEIRGLVDDFIAEANPEESDEVEAEVLDKMTTEDVVEVMNRISSHFGDFEGNVSGLTELKEEVESWRDNMQGTNLENTSKYSELEDCISELEGAITTLENVQEPSMPPITQEMMNIDEVRQYCDDVETAYQDIESGADDAEGVNFPGMY